MRISLRLCLAQIFPFLSSMITFSNRGRCRRGVTRTCQHILSHHGAVFLMSKSRSGLTATLALGGFWYPASLTLLGKSITQLRVLNIRLFIMLRLWRGRIDPERWVRRSLKRRGATFFPYYLTFNCVHIPNLLVLHVPKNLLCWHPLRPVTPFLN